MSRRLGILAIGLATTLWSMGGAWAAPPQMTRAQILCRAASGVGYSYYWGGGCWCADGCSAGNCARGSCSGSCPGCTHSGTYGADCSGYVSKVWQVPNSIATTSCGHGSYVAANYTHTSSYWTVISRNNLQGGDSMATSHHVLLYDHGDPWGSLVAYEARGCSYGIVHNWRSCSSDYVAARRINLGPSCECAPGQDQTESCGNCGSRSRACTAECQWGAWTACHNQGVCTPGSVDSRSCCDCGSQQRTCSTGCEWTGWTGCEGPDPSAGEAICDTGEPGPCAPGHVRCVQGCTSCARDYAPVAELCDSVDNDCNGDVDDGDPSDMGTPRPDFAARLTDVSQPQTLAAGETGEAWAVFVNEGVATWPAGELWLASMSSEHDGGSALYDEETWPAYDVAAVLENDVPPGESGFFSWTVRVRDSIPATDSFRLADPSGASIRCPAPQVDISIRTSLRSADRPGASPGSADAAPDVSDGCACRAGAPAGSRWHVGWVAAFAWLLVRRRRRNGSAPASRGY